MEYENKVVLLSQEVERLNGSLRTRSVDYESLSQKFRTLEEQLVYYRGLEPKLKDCETRLEGSFRSIESLREDLSRTSGELQRLKPFETRSVELNG